MSFRSSEGAQWRDAEAAKAKKAAHLVLQANGRYTVSTTGPADAYLGASGVKYMSLPGSTGNYASTPDSAAISITGDIDLRIKVALDDYTPGVGQVLIAKYAAGAAYQLQHRTDGTLRLLLNGAAAAISTVAIPTANGATVWLRATWRQSDGRVQFFTGDDGATWTQLGADGSAVVASINDTADPTEIGAWNGGANDPTAGKIYRAQVYNGIGGTLVADFDPGLASNGDTSVVASTGETWTVHQSGSPTAEIAGGSSRVLISPTATAHENSARLVKVGDRHRIF